jgi:hypothetical protein
MRIYVHREGRAEPEAVAVSGEVAVAEAVGPGVEVVLVEDSDELLDLTVTLQEAHVADRDHLFAGARHRIEVEVTYNGERAREFSSSARVERVFEWAVGPEGFNLSHADAIEHQLALCATQEVPAPDVHIGSLPEDRPGHLCFDLIPKHRHEG